MLNTTDNISSIESFHVFKILESTSLLHHKLIQHVLVKSENPTVWINQVCYMTEAQRTAEQLQLRESAQLKHNPKFFTVCSISSSLEPCGTSKNSVSQCCDEAAEQHSARLFSVTCYTHTPRGWEGEKHCVMWPIFTYSRESERLRGWSSRAIGEV